MKATKWMAAAFLAGSVGLIVACGDDGSGNSKSSGGGSSASNKGGGANSSDQTGNEDGDPGYKKYCESQGEQPLGDTFACKEPRGKKDCSDWENCCDMSIASKKGGSIVMEQGMPFSFSGGSMSIGNTVPYGTKCR